VGVDGGEGVDQAIEASRVHPILPTPRPGRRWRSAARQAVAIVGWAGTLDAGYTDCGHARRVPHALRLYVKTFPHVADWLGRVVSDEGFRDRHPIAPLTHVALLRRVA
jgi:hypothetical protein